VLLIASGAADERAIANSYCERIGVNAILWYLPDAGHTGGLGRHPKAYATRVVGFFNAALAHR